MKVKSHVRIDLYAETENEHDKLTDLLDYITSNFSSALWRWM